MPTRWIIPASLSAVLLGLPGVPSAASARREAGASVLAVGRAEVDRGLAADRDRAGPRPSGARTIRSANVVHVPRTIRHAILRSQSPPPRPSSRVS